MGDPTTWMADGRALIDGSATGVALVLDEPLSFWGGVDQATGTIIDRHHPQAGADVSGRALVMPHGRGSSSSSSVLAEAIRAGHGPALIVLLEADEIVVLGALVSQILDGSTVPVVTARAADFGRIRTGDVIRLEPGGRIEIRPR